MSYARLRRGLKEKYGQVRARTKNRTTGSGQATRHVRAVQSPPPTESACIPSPLSFDKESLEVNSLESLLHEVTEETQQVNAAAYVSEETRLLAESFLQDRYDSQVPEFSRTYDRLPYLARMETLLQAGADPNIVVCVYEVEGRAVHRIIGEEDKSKFIEGPYASICGPMLTESSDAANPHFKEDVFISCLAPFIEGILSQDIEIVFLLVKYGADIKSFIASPWLTTHPSLIRAQYWTDSIATRGQLIQAFLCNGDFIADVPLWVWIICHLTKTLSAIGSFDISYRDQEFFTRTARQEISRKALRFCRIPQEVLRLVKERPNLLTGLMMAEPASHIAVVLDNPDLLRFALTDGGQEHVDGQGITTLHIAAGNLNCDMCEQLLDLGVDPNARDMFGITPLMDAIYFGHITAVQILLEAGAEILIYAERPSINIRDRGNSGLSGEWRGHRNTCISTFLELGWSVLHMAVWNGTKALIALFVKIGVDMEQDDFSGRTALDLAIDLRRFDMVGLLLDLGATLGTNSIPASLLLENAVAAQKQDVVNQLLGRGVKSIPTDAYLAAHLDGCNLAERVESLDHALLGPSRDIHPHTLWLLTRRLPQVQCPHVNYWVRSEEFPECGMCLLLAGQAEYLPSKTFPVGALFALALEHDHETQTYWLSSQVSRSEEARHQIKYVPDELHKLLESYSCSHDRSTKSLSATATSHHWLQSCANDHEMCRYRGSSYNPTRLIELLSKDTIRLVQRRSRHKYVALSHRWGQDDGFKTTLSNFERRLSCFQTEQLSPTLKDALEAARALGHRFVWVDVLCIIQDSAEDWIREAAEMCHVYSNATVTIAAECNDEIDASEGMFRDRAIRHLRPFHIGLLEGFAGEKLRHLIEPPEEIDQQLYIFPGLDEGKQSVRPKGVLDSRGWILQEQLLSPRILYYGQQQLFWDCVSQSASEVSPLATSLLQDSNSTELWAFRLLRRTITGNGDKQTLAQQLADVWIHVVQNYSARTLTNSSDKLIALQGVITAIEGVLVEKSVAGMWEKDLWKQLIWWTENSANQSYTNATTNTGTSSFSAPTWSWLSANGPIFHHDAVRIDRNPIARRLNELVAVSGLTYRMNNRPSTATNVSATLTLSAPTFSYTLTFNDLRELTWKRGHPAKLNLAPARWMINNPLQLPQKVRCVILAEDQVAKMTVAMCLIPAKSEPEYWERAGLCLWDGLIWQIAKYVCHELEEMPFTIV